MFTDRSLLKKVYHLSCMAIEQCKFIRRSEVHAIFQSEILKKKDPLERINSRWGIILKWILVKYMAK